MNLLSQCPPKYNQFCSCSSLSCPSFSTSSHSFFPLSASHSGSGSQKHPFYDFYPSPVEMSRLLTVWQTAEMRFKHIWLHATKALCKAHLSARALKMHLVLFSLLFAAYEEDNFCLKMAPLKELSMPLVPITIEIKVSRPSPIKITHSSLNMSLTLFSIWLLAAILDLLRIAESSSIIAHRSHYLSFPSARRYLLRQTQEVEFKCKEKKKIKEEFTHWNSMAIIWLPSRTLGCWEVNHNFCLGGDSRVQIQ